MSTTSSRAPAEQLSPELRQLAATPSETTPYRLWKAIGEEDRRQAARACWELDDRAPLVDLVARTFNFRESTVSGWEADRVAQYVGRLRPHSPSGLNQLLLRLHLPERSDLLGDFLDQLGLPHEKGQLTRPAHEFDVERDKVRRAADNLADRHPLDHVVTYFLTLLMRGDDFAPGLDDWLRDLVRGSGPSSVDRERSDAVAGTEGTGAGPDPASAPSAGEFTTLDRQLIRTIVDVAQGIEGALSADQLDDLVGEVIQLNSDRHQSYFHAGFSDVVLGRPAREELPAQNDTRLRWYWSGCLSGLARRERWAEIERHYDEEPAVRDLGHGDRGPAPLAARIVFKALCDADRPGEAAEFLEPDVVVADSSLLLELKQVGTRLLRADRAAEARVMFDLLGEAVERLKEFGVDTKTPLFLEILRRRAHCYRQLGDAALASQLLHRLLERESSPGIRAMAQTDLGLIDGGFRRLSDLVIPAEPERQELLREALEEGEERFRAAASADARYSAHGQYCLGILALLRDDSEAAVDHLDVALSVFESQPDRYSHGNLLANARLYLAAAIAQDLQTGRNPKVAELVRKGLDGADHLPPAMLRNILTVLAMTSDSLAQEVAEAVLEREGANRLNVLVESDVAAKSYAITTALLDRARDEDRGATDRAADFRRVLPLLLEQRRVDEAAVVLDRLEGAAREGVGRSEFAELLEEPSNYEPAWERADSLWARVQCLEAGGDYQAATALLEEEGHRVLSNRSFGYLQEAEALIEKIASYAPSEERLGRLRSRLKAEKSAAAAEEIEPEADRGRVRVLFVGGNETQEQYDEEIHREFKEEGADIEVTFLHTGWSSNWSRHLETAKRELPAHDGVVLMRFMRTEFGRQLRKEIDVPWRGCAGTGKRAMKETIRTAASAARRHLRRQEAEIREQ